MAACKLVAVCQQQCHMLCVQMSPSPDRSKARLPGINQWVANAGRWDLWPNALQQGQRGAMGILCPANCHKHGWRRRSAQLHSQHCGLALVHNAHPWLCLSKRDSRSPVSA